MKFEEEEVLVCICIDKVDLYHYTQGTLLRAGCLIVVKTSVLVTKDPRFDPRLQPLLQLSVKVAQTDRQTDKVCPQTVTIKLSFCNVLLFQQ